jgi:hypothetical protein
VLEGDEALEVAHVRADPLELILGSGGVVDDVADGHEGLLGLIAEAP